MMFRFLNKNKWRILIAGILVMLCAVGLLGFKFLVKVGNVKYLYNYQNDTRGSLPVEQQLKNKVNADLSIAKATEDTLPSKLQISTRIQVDGVDVESYQRSNPIFFTEDDINDMAKSGGILTFRGDYHRNLQAFGEASITSKQFDDEIWSFSTGKVLKSNGVDYWSGNGWTGQPLAVQWDTATKRIMNMYASAKNKANLVEVIYSGMDGFIHFFRYGNGTTNQRCHQCWYDI